MQISRDNNINMILKGVGVSGGVGIGQVVLIERVASDICPCYVLQPDEVEAELLRFENAVESAAERLMTI